jgi:nitrogen fixation protein NifB
MPFRLSRERISVAIDISKHPCFDPAARGQFGRVHLPVAPRCNVQCNFCDRQYACVNESRPGVTANVLSPRQALVYLDRSVARNPRIAVVGIAGPGDPFANAEETMETLRLTRRQYPEMLLCVATNGLSIRPHTSELAALNTSHVTITVNAVNPETGAKIYAWIRDGKRPFRGTVAARMLLERQLDAICELKRLGVTVKINTIVLPGINAEEVPMIARTVSEFGADIHNCIPLYPSENTPFGDLAEPTPGQMLVARHAAGQFMPQMTHCNRCRADACGLLGQEHTEDTLDDLTVAAQAPLNPNEQRPYVAVATMEDVLVNLHLGEAAALSIYGATRDGYELIHRRDTPAPGGGHDRWTALASQLSDCRAVICTSAGGKPASALKEAGIRVVMMEGLIEEGLEAVYAGRDVRAPLRKEHRCGAGASCAGDGTGCG